MAGVRGELVERTLMHQCAAILTLPSKEPLATLRGEHCSAFLAHGILFSARTPGCRITVLNTLLQPQPDAISSAPCCLQQLDHCEQLYPVAHSAPGMPPSDLPYSFSYRFTTSIRSKSLGAATRPGGFCGTGDFSGVGLGVGTVPLSSLAPYLQWWTPGALSELPVVSETWLGWTGCVWLMGSELEGGCGITLGNEWDIFNGSTEVWQLNTFCWFFSVPLLSCLYFKDLCVRLLL